MMITSPLRANLLAYAQRLIDAFEQDLSRLSKSGVGLKKASRIPMFLETMDTAREPKTPGSVAHLLNEDAAPTFQQDSTASSGDFDVLDTWATASDRHPLLIVAPFGAGKSVLIATFTLKLCYQLKADLAKKSIRRLFVPLPVRLRSFIEFSSKHANQRYIRFMAASQRVLTPNAKKGDLLTPPLLEDLLHKGWLLPLFDGFDELPGDFDDRSSLTRKEVLDHIRDVCGDSFCLTSRPAAARETGIDRQHVLQDLTTKDIVHFIATHFKHSITSAETAFSSLSPELQSLCRRPLLLAALCDSTNVDDYGREEQTVGSVMTALVYRCFDKRRRITRVTDAELPTHLLKLGALFALCACTLFRKAAAPSDVVEALSGNPLFRDETECLRTIDLAVALEFGARLPDGSFYAYKIPLVEFLVGRHLATAPSSASTVPIHLAAAVRRWVWIPTMHDVLDHTFEALWNGSKEQRRWAALLIQWLTQMRHAPSPYTTPIDIESDTPFAWTALQWLDGDRDCNDVSMPTYAKDCIDAVIDRNWQEVKEGRRATPLSTANASIVRYAMDVVWTRWQAAVGPDDRRKWKDVLIFGGELSQHSVASCVDRILHVYLQTCDSDDALLWCEVLYSLYQRVDCEFADAIVTDFLNSLPPLTNDADYQGAMVRGAAYRCGPVVLQRLRTVALAKVELSDSVSSWWLDMLGRTLHGDGSQMKSGDIVLRMLRMAKKHHADADILDTCKCLAWRAADHVEPTAIVPLIEEMVHSLIDRRQGGKESWIAGWNRMCRYTFSVVARGIRRQDNATLMERWRRNCDASQGAVQETWKSLMYFAARVANRRDAPRLFTALRRRCARDEQSISYWWGAMNAMARNLSPDDARSLARDIVAKNTEAGRIQLACRSDACAIVALLQSMRAEDAQALGVQILDSYCGDRGEFLVDDWWAYLVHEMGQYAPFNVLLSRLQRYDISDSPKSDRGWWIGMLEESLERLEGTIEVEVVRYLIDERQTALEADPSTDEFDQRTRLIQETCQKVVRRSLESLCNEFIQNGRSEDAWCIVRARPDLVISGLRVNGIDRFRVVSREEAVLDEGLEFAPDEIRRALAIGDNSGETKADESKHEIRWRKWSGDEIAHWFLDLQWPDLRERLHLFLWVAKIDRAAMQKRLAAKGYSDLEGCLCKRETGLKHAKQTYIRRTITMLDDMTSKHPFPPHLWRKGEQGRCRIKLYPDRKKGGDERWTARAWAMRRLVATALKALPPEPANGVLDSNVSVDN